MLPVNFTSVYKDKEEVLLEANVFSAPALSSRVSHLRHQKAIGTSEDARNLSSKKK